MKNPLLEDEYLSNAIVKKIASVLEVGPESIEKQLDEFDEDTTREVIRSILNSILDPGLFSSDVLRSYLEDTFERSSVVYIFDFYNQLSDKFNGKYTPEELELICEYEKQLVCSLLKDNDFVETKSNLYQKRYNKNCKPIAISVSPHADIADVIKELTKDPKPQGSKS